MLLVNDVTPKEICSEEMQICFDIIESSSTKELHDR